MKPPICMTCLNLKRIDLSTHGKPNSRRYYCMVSLKQLRTNAKLVSDVLVECKDYAEDSDAD